MKVNIRKSGIVALVILMISMALSGCTSSTNTESEVYAKRTQVAPIETEPESYRKYALVSSGNIKVSKSLTTDGPLADVHANGEINARALSLDISGQITSSNSLDSSIVRSFNYTSGLEKSSFVDIRALKVSEYLNTSMLDEYYLLAADGIATHKIEDGDDTNITEDGVEFVFANNKWTIKGNNVELSLPLKVESGLNIEANSLFIAGTLMVQGDLNASGELNINTGTPFDKALIVDNNIEVDKLVTIGRVHGSGTFTSHGEVNILGNAEIDGNVTLYGDAKINYLDNIYKAALYETQEESNETNSSMMLVHSQLFSNAVGKNSVVLFTFIEGDYILNEHTLYELLESNETSSYNFKSYLYGATIDYGAQLQKFDGLSPYYANKLALMKKLKSQGYENIKISESLDIAPSNLYHTYEDSSGNNLGTYQIYSLATIFDLNNTVLLTQSQRDEAIYNIEHKDEIEAAQEREAKEQELLQKQSILDNNETNATIKDAQMAELELIENNTSNIDKDALKIEITQDRVQEWVEYKDLADESIEVNATQIILKDDSVARGWKKRWKKRLKKVFRVITYTDCKKKTERRRILGVDSDATFYRNDRWFQDITIFNDIGYCTPTAIAMIMNYNSHVRKGKNNLYNGLRLSSNNPESLRMAKEFHTHKVNGTSWWRYFWEVPYDTYKETRRLGMNGYSYSWYTTFWNRDRQHNKIQWYIRKNNPVMFNAMKGTRISGYGKVGEGHSMPVIGYKRDYYKGVCWKRVVPEKKWILVDTEFNQRGYIRFDSRANYLRGGTITYVRVY